MKRTVNIGTTSDPIWMEMDEVIIQPKTRDRYTDGKFVTREEYQRIIRKLKLKEIYDRKV